MKEQTIQHTVIFKATPIDVYYTIMDAEKHSDFTASEVVIVNQEGTIFSAYDGYIEGKNVTLVEGKKIVQLWQALEEGWPEEHISEVTFEFEPHTAGTLMKFTHKNVPEKMFKSIEQGCKDHYWAAMHEWFQEL
jgi:activator of HSP90 ATPase